MNNNLKQAKTIYFDTYSEQKIGDTTYITESHFLEEGETVIDKLKKLIKSDSKRSNLQ